MAFLRAQVIGAGMAGLAAAVELSAAGCPVSLSEAGPPSGGRCRSYFDPSLGLTIDNGNHLVLAGNPAVARFREVVGADAPLAGPLHADFAFADLATGERWTLRINDGPVPWWVLVPSRRVPGSRLADYLPLGRLLKGRADQTIGDLVKPQGPVWERMLHPVLLAALNTDPAASSAALCANVLAETLAKGGRASAPRVAVPTLAAAFIDPAVDWLEAKGVALQTGRRLRGIRFEGDCVSALEWAEGAQAIGADEAVVLAVPAWVAASLVPDLTVPDDHRSILNAHFACTPPAGAPEMLGLTNGDASDFVGRHRHPRVAKPRLCLRVLHAGGLCLLVSGSCARRHRRRRATATASTVLRSCTCRFAAGRACRVDNDRGHRPHRRLRGLCEKIRVMPHAYRQHSTAFALPAKATAE